MSARSGRPDAFIPADTAAPRNPGTEKRPGATDDEAVGPDSDGGGDARGDITPFWDSPIPLVTTPRSWSAMVMGFQGSRTPLTPEQITTLMEAEFPEAAALGLRIDALDETSIAVGWPGAASRTRPGGTISGPAMMTLVDTVAYFLVLSRVGPETLAVTTNLDIHFLRRPAPGELFGRGELLKLGKRLVVIAVRLHVGDDPAPVAHATVTYSVPRPGRRAVPAGLPGE
ncbi:MAG: PaaI family thioesterase [Myxococcota bacterium]